MSLVIGPSLSSEHYWDASSFAPFRFLTHLEWKRHGRFPELHDTLGGFQPRAVSSLTAGGQSPPPRPWQGLILSGGSDRGSICGSLLAPLPCEPGFCPLSSHSRLIQVWDFCRWLRAPLGIQDDHILRSSAELHLPRAFLQMRSHLGNAAFGGGAPLHLLPTLSFLLCRLFCRSSPGSPEPALGAVHHKGSGEPHFSTAQPCRHPGVLSMLRNSPHTMTRVSQSWEPRPRSNALLIPHKPGLGHTKTSCRE